MRIITGTAKGKILKTLEGLEVRPTSDKVKEAMFSAIQFDIAGADILDLFAGSGQLGIEALSRGAESAVFVDKSKKAAGIIRQNLEMLNFLEHSHIHCIDSTIYLKSCGSLFDIVFVDPPYGQGLVLRSLENLADKVNSKGKIICEHESHLKLPHETGGFFLKKDYSYGKIKVSIYERSA